MKVLGYVVIGIGCVACLTLIFLIPGAVLIGLGCLLIIGSKHVSPAVNRVVAFCVLVPVCMVVIVGTLTLFNPTGTSSRTGKPQPSEAQLTTVKKDKAQKPSKFKECDYTKPGSSVRQICEDQAASKRTPKATDN